MKLCGWRDCDAEVGEIHLDQHELRGREGRLAVIGRQPQFYGLARRMLEAEEIDVVQFLRDIQMRKMIVQSIMKIAGRLA